MELLKGTCIRCPKCHAAIAITKGTIDDKWKFSHELLLSNNLLSPILQTVKKPFCIRCKENWIIDSPVPTLWHDDGAFYYNPNEKPKPVNDITVFEKKYAPNTDMTFYGRIIPINNQGYVKSEYILPNGLVSDGRGGYKKPKTGHSVQELIKKYPRWVFQKKP